MEKRIAILTSGHSPFDERIFWKFARSLDLNGYNVTIICSTLIVSDVQDNITILGFEGSRMDKNSKIDKFTEQLDLVSPDIIICSEPLPVVAAHDYKRKKRNNCLVISDVTEWYPENYLMKLSFWQRILKYPLYLLFNMYASNVADGIIIGEKGKKRRYDIIAPFKKKIIVGYYPVVEFYEFNAPAPGREVVLCYAGVLSFSRGIMELLDAALAIADRRKKQRIKLKLIGKFEHPHEEAIFNETIKDIRKVHIEICERSPYPEFSHAIEDADICFDLRKRNFIYRNSLPIKVFDYMASGKPFIFSDIKPLRKELDVSKFGKLVNPEDQSEIVSAIEDYLNNKKILVLHAINARREIDEIRNWEMESLKLLLFLRSFK